MENIKSLLSELSKARPVFHSEADFQHALAWQIKLQKPNVKVRLEYPLSIEQELDEDLDILISDNQCNTAIELKYKTSPFFAPLDSEIFHLKGQGAQDQGRYDFLKDISRLERYVSKTPKANGYAIFLSNDSSYWRPPRDKVTVCDEFRLTEGKTILGALSWGKNAGKGTTNREKHQ